MMVKSPRRRRQWQPTPVLLPGKSLGRRSLVGCSPWGREESDMTERLHFHFSFSCTREGNGNPFQCSCLENPRDEGAWWAAIYGVAQSWTRLKQLSLAISSMHSMKIKLQRLCLLKSNSSSRGNLSLLPAQSLKLRVLINSHTVGVWKKHEERLVLRFMLH